MKILFNTIRDNLLFGPGRAWWIKYKERRRKFTNFLSVVAIIKNEAAYMSEWLDFHIKHGVDKFYIYDNESTDDIKSVLRPYIESGVVEYKYFPGKKMQLKAYRDALRRHKYDTKWLAFIDADEFFITKKHKNIAEFLRAQPENIAQIILGCALYGSSAHIAKPKGGVLKNFSHRAVKNDQCKAIVNPRLVESITSCHYTHVAGKSVDEKGRRIAPDPWGEYGLEIARVNHYKTKSRDECFMKMSFGDALFGARRKSAEKYFADFDKNEVHDAVVI